MSYWARFIVAGRWFWIIGWPIVALLCWVDAPRMESLLHDDAHGFVPADMPSQQAFATLRDEFPDQAPASRAAIVFFRSGGLTASDHTFIDGIARALVNQQDRWGWRVRAGALTPFLRRFFESDDGAAAVVVVDFPAEMLTHSTVNRVREVRTIMDSSPPPSGLTIELTGSAALGELLDASAKRDVNLTTLWTFTAVILILLCIYRSPVAMLLPMITIGLALMTALGLIGREAARGLPVNGLLETFVVVLVVGTGVDYCLFLFARFREELAQTDDVRQAVTGALRHTGAAILGSTGTNAAGLATLILARHRDLHTSGPAIAFALCIGAMVVLTFTPALMSVVGRGLLWPTVPQRGKPDEGRWWCWAARVVTRRPGAVAAATLALLAFPAMVGVRVRATYDALADFPAESSFVRGAHLYTRHFHHSQEVTEFTLLISGNQRFDGDENQTTVTCLREAGLNLRADFPVVYIRHLADPLGSGQADEWKLFGAIAERLARNYCVGKSGKTLRVDVGLKAAGRSPAGMASVDRFIEVFSNQFLGCMAAHATDASAWTIQASGEAPLYRDIRALRSHDFRMVASAACGAIFVILWLLTRSTITSVILLAATLLTFLATYGATWILFTRFWGTESVSHQLPFLLFIILMSLGQDYNIYVVTRIAEERRRLDWVAAVETAIRGTGRVVSSCGIIMAAAFGSMLAGKLLLMKQFGVALALGILLDTFVIRPLLVPALLMIVNAGKRSRNED